jgi:calcineurin-like phosphoesterase family protein
MNVHGHVHQNTLPDKRYINVSVEEVVGLPLSLDELRKKRDVYISSLPHYGIVDDDNG